MGVDVEEIVREYIDKTFHMSLATVSGERPWGCEVHFVYDNDLNLYFRSLKTRRHSREIAKNPRVAGNIVRQHALDQYPHAIYFEGSVEMITAEAEFAEIGRRFMQRLGLPDSIIEDAKRQDGYTFYKIAVENWYAFGKFRGENGEKFQLAWNGGRR